MENNIPSDKASPLTIVISILLLVGFSLAVSSNSSTSSRGDIEQKNEVLQISTIKNEENIQSTNEQDDLATSKNGNVPEKTCNIKGNISDDGRKIYHTPDAPYYSKVTMEREKGERWFCTEEEAIGAGWRKEEASTYDANYNQEVILTPEQKAEQEELYRDALRDAENELPSVPSFNY